MPRLRPALAAALALTAALAACSPLAPGGPSGSRVPGPAELAPVFSLVQPSSVAEPWTAAVADLVADADARLRGTAPAARRLASASPVAGPAASARETEVPGLGTVQRTADVSIGIEDGVLHGSLELGLESEAGAPAFRHVSSTRIPVCLAEGEEFVTGDWQLRHTQRNVEPDGRVIDLEVTISATLTATSAGGRTFDVEGLHAHIRRTDTLPGGETVMGQGSVQASVAGIPADDWASHLSAAILGGAREVHTRDAWVREEGWGYVGVALLSMEVPASVTRAQEAAEEGEGCGGWAVVPVELHNTFLNPLGDVAEIRRWSGHVCGDPFTTAWTLTEETESFRGTESERHEIVPLAAGRPMEVFGVMPRIEPVDGAAPGDPPFRLSFEERWPDGVRAVGHQIADAAVVPAAAELCAR